MRVAVLALAAVVAAGSADAASRYDWDDLGEEFCRLSMTGNLAAVAPLLTPSLVALLGTAMGNPEMPPAQVLFQSYSNPVPACEAKTVNAALVAIQRGGANRTAPQWTEYLVVVPEMDGTTRIDDVLFATRKSDTLRTRLEAWAAGR